MGQLTQAAKSGNRRRLLETLRDELAKALEMTDSGRDIAALSRRLLEVTAELDGLPNDSAEPDELDAALDELA